MKQSWFPIRQDLSAQKQIFLTVCSFLFPIFLWCLISYVPNLWQPDIQIQISADRPSVSTVYIAGDRLPREREFEDDFIFDDFAQAIRDQNAEIMAAQEAGEPLKGSRRANKKILRHLAAVGIIEGWLSRDQATDDAAIYELWKDLATGKKETSKMTLSDENKEIIEKNWAILSAISETYQSQKIPKETLISLVPQGIPSNPVYVPAPHEVLQTGWHDWTSTPGNDAASMWERYRHSLYIVFAGFLLSCVVGLPLGILGGTYDFFAKLFEPFIDFFRYMPAPAFGTVMVAVFSVYDAPKIGLVFVGTVFQMVLVISKTTRQLDKALLEAAQTLGAKSHHLMFRVIIPGILPNLYNDLRILLGWAWTWLVIAELIGTKSGLTEFIETQGRFRNFDSVYPTIIMIGLTGFFTDQLLAAIRPLFFGWEISSQSKKPFFLVRFFQWLFNRDCYTAPSFHQANDFKSDTNRNDQEKGQQ